MGKKRFELLFNAAVVIFIVYIILLISTFVVGIENISNILFPIFGLLIVI